jgi:Tol biopolymer transport system component
MALFVGKRVAWLALAASWLVLAGAWVGNAPIANSRQPPIGPELTPRLKIAFVSNRGHYWYPHVFLYEHDGISHGRVAGSIDPRDQRLDHHPALSADGMLCVFGSEQEAQVGTVQAWDLRSNSRLDWGDFAKTPNAIFSPSLSANGQWLVFSTWNRPGRSSRWDLGLFDVTAKQLVELPGVNTAGNDERRACISGNGQWIAFTSNSPDGKGLTDVRLYQRGAENVLTLPEINSPASDTFPSLDDDGRLICLASDRDGGLGGFDIYLFDRDAGKFVDLPGLNSPGHEQSPSLSADGRFISFVSERLESEGEHDIFVYDRTLGKLLPTPGLNTDRDDYDPCLIVLK